MIQINLPAASFPGWTGSADRKGGTMKSDLQLKSDVTAELAWDPAANDTNVGVAARGATRAVDHPQVA
jgi:hypothetical protein